MPYPEQLKQLIKAVEKTRPERVEKKKNGEEIPFMSLDERKQILNHHPDINEESRREIRIGPSKGYAIPHELVDLLEARATIDPAAIDLTKPDLETDLLVIGGGNLVVLTWELKQYSAVLGLPIAFVYSVIPITGILICFYALASAMGEEIGEPEDTAQPGS